MLKNSEVETVYVVSSGKAKGVVNEHLIQYVGSSFMAGEPEIVKTLDSVLWKVPVFLAYPSKGVVGKVGDYFVDADAGNIASVTPKESILEHAEALLKNQK